MFQFEAAMFVLGIEELRLLSELIKDSGRADSTEDGKELVNLLLDKTMEHAAVLPSASDFELKIHTLRQRLNDSVMPAYELGVRLEALHQDICADLLKPAFLMIPESKVELFNQAAPPFGEDVVNMFADAGADIAAASRCLALDEWTACVFLSIPCVDSLRSSISQWR